MSNETNDEVTVVQRSFLTFAIDCRDDVRPCGMGLRPCHV